MGRTALFATGPVTMYVRAAGRGYVVPVSPPLTTAGKNAMAHTLYPDPTGGSPPKDSGMSRRQPRARSAGSADRAYHISTAEKRANNYMSKRWPEVLQDSSWEGARSATAGGGEFLHERERSSIGGYESPIRRGCSSSLGRYSHLEGFSGSRWPETVVPARPAPTRSTGTGTVLRKHQKGKLKVHVRKATNLLAGDTGFLQSGLSDPYVSITTGGQNLRTKTMHRQLNPVWDETLEFSGTLGTFVSMPFELKVMDEDNFGLTGESLGELKLSLSMLKNKTRAKFVQTLPTQGSIEFHLTWEAEPTPVAATPSQPPPSQRVQTRSSASAFRVASPNPASPSQRGQSRSPSSPFAMVAPGQGPPSHRLPESRPFPPSVPTPTQMTPVQRPQIVTRGRSRTGEAVREAYLRNEAKRKAREAKSKAGNSSRRGCKPPPCLPASLAPESGSGGGGFGIPEAASPPASPPQKKAKAGGAWADMLPSSWGASSWGASSWGGPPGNAIPTIPEEEEEAGEDSTTGAAPALASLATPSYLAPTGLSKPPTGLTKPAVGEGSGSGAGEEVAVSPAAESAPAGKVAATSPPKSKEKFSPGTTTESRYVSRIAQVLAELGELVDERPPAPQLPEARKNEMSTKAFGENDDEEPYTRSPFRGTCGSSPFYNGALWLRSG